VSVGLLLVSTSPSFQVINPAHLHQILVDDQRARWQLGDAVTSPAGGRIPIGGSVGPLAGATYLITGDAGGIANPFTGSGVDTALETGIIAADVVAEAIDAGNPAALQQYPQLLDERYGAYDKIGRLVDRALGRPAFARWLHSQIVGNRAVADGTVRIALQHLRRGRAGLPELMYRVGRTVSIFAPDA
jgi:flavin-dependent dehydrogenase